MTKTVEERLLDLTKGTMVRMTEDDFEISDVNQLTRAINQIESVRDEELKPHLIIWDLNVWLPIREHIEEALGIIGYEYVGNMDTDEYKFECEDELRDILFRYRDVKCDYTRTLKL